MTTPLVRTLGAIGVAALIAGCSSAAPQDGVTEPVGTTSAVATVEDSDAHSGSQTPGSSGSSGSLEVTTSSNSSDTPPSADLAEPVDLEEPPEHDAVPPEVARAIESAKGYLAFTPFSKKGLIEQLSSEFGDGYPRDVAEIAVQSLDTDWKEQAAQAAANYLDLMAFSKDGLIEQLESEFGDGYTHEEAVYGAEQAYGGGGASNGGEPDSSAEVANAITAAEGYLDLMAFSEQGLIDQLSSSAGDGYSKGAATAAVRSLTVDWDEQAATAAQNYLDLMPFSKSELIDQLVQGDGFTRDQATYGVGQVY